MNALPPKKQLQLVWPCISIKEGRWAYWEVVDFPRCGWPTQCMLLDMSHFKGNDHSWRVDIAVFRRYWYVPWYSTWTSYTNCTFSSSAMYLSPMYIILHNSCFSVFQINIWYTQVCTASFTLQRGAQDCPRASGWSTAQGGQMWRKAAGSEKCLELEVSPSAAKINLKSSAQGQSRWVWSHFDILPAGARPMSWVMLH